MEKKQMLNRKQLIYIFCECIKLLVTYNGAYLTDTTASELVQRINKIAEDCKQNKICLSLLDLVLRCVEEEQVDYKKGVSFFDR